MGESPHRSNTHPPRSSLNREKLRRFERRRRKKSRCLDIKEANLPFGGSGLGWVALSLTKVCCEPKLRTTSVEWEGRAGGAGRSEVGVCLTGTAGDTAQQHRCLGLLCCQISCQCLAVFKERLKVGQDCMFL